MSGSSIEVAISALGTTWRKAGSWPAFEEVDHHAVVGFAHAARAAGARQFITISSVGADIRSGNEYLALKGRVEGSLGAIGFERVDIMRPGLLRGDRGMERRRGERLGILLSPLTNLMMRGGWDRYAAIDAAIVARAMNRLIGAQEDGNFIHHNRDIHGLIAARGDEGQMLR